MKMFAERRNYMANAYRHLTLDELSLFPAAIVPISNVGYNHYVVFNGIDRDRVRLADPAFGHRTLTVREFKSIWLDGIAFVIEANP
jgi:predicted double-glycine peptidase